jgi:hypothetical protein
MMAKEAAVASTGARSTVATPPPDTAGCMQKLLWTLELRAIPSVTQAATPRAPTPTATRARFQGHATPRHTRVKPYREEGGEEKAEGGRNRIGEKQPK